MGYFGARSKDERAKTIDGFSYSAATEVGIKRAGEVSEEQAQ